MGETGGREDLRVPEAGRMTRVESQPGPEVFDRTPDALLHMSGGVSLERLAMHLQGALGNEGMAAMLGRWGDVPFRAEMESAFGRDFGDVSVQLGADLGSASGATAGSHVAFASTHPDREVVAHELTHVVQSDESTAGGGVSRRSDPAENEARTVAAQVTKGERAPAVTASRHAAVHLVGEETEEERRARIAHDAVLEQMSHGATYAGNETGDVVSHGEGVDTDRRAMLEQAGYQSEPRLISGANGFQMVVYMPAEGAEGVRPVVSFRGTSESADVVSDLNPDGVGEDQYSANEELIQQQIALANEASGGMGVEMTGHSLGGALAQMAAARNPDAVGNITTFQAAGVSQEDVERMRAHNEERERQGLPPINSTHYRMEGDIVPNAGEGFTDGTIHEFAADRGMGGAAMSAGAGAIGNLLGGPLGAALGMGAEQAAFAHTAMPLTAAAMEFQEGRDALPGITGPTGYSVSENAPVSTDENNSEFRFTEMLRKGAGFAGRGVSAAYSAGSELLSDGYNLAGDAVGAGYEMAGDAVGAVGNAASGAYNMASDAVGSGIGALGSAGQAIWDWL